MEPKIKLGDYCDDIAGIVWTSTIASVLDSVNQSIWRSVWISVWPPTLGAVVSIVRGKIRNGR